MSKFPDASSQQWLDLKKRSLQMIEDFKRIREEFTTLYSDCSLNELGGSRQPTIVRKLRHFPGDITPTMFASLIKEVENNQ